MYTFRIVFIIYFFKVQLFILYQNTIFVNSLYVDKDLMILASNLRSKKITKKLGVFKGFWGLTDSVGMLYWLVLVAF